MQFSNEGNQEDKTPCYFENGFTEDEFNLMAKDACKGIRRLKTLSVNGAIVYGTFRSQSGITDWKFSINYNNQGSLDGSYRITSQSDDSEIPRVVADRIATSIKVHPKYKPSTSTSPSARKRRKETSVRLIAAFIFIVVIFAIVGIACLRN